MIDSKRLFKQSESYLPLSISQKTARIEVMEWLENQDFEFRTCCPLCKGKEDNFYLMAQRDINAFPINVVYCMQCGFMFQSRILEQKAYDFYYQKWSMKIRGKQIDDEKLMSDLFDKRINSYAKKRYEVITNTINLEKNGTVVEIGCNDGANLYPFFKASHEVIGFDLDKTGLEVGVKKGLPLFQENFFDYIEKHHLDIKLVLLNHFLEHVIDPVEFLNKLFAVLPSNAYCFIEVPGFKDQTWLSRSSGLLSYFDFEHISYFDKNSLSCMAELCGFRPIFVDEFVCGLFKKDQATIPSWNAGDGLNYLANIEKFYLGSLRGMAKEFRSQVRRILR